MTRAEKAELYPYPYGVGPVTVAEVLDRFPVREGGRLPTMPYHSPPRPDEFGSRLGLTVGANKSHMTDEAHQLFRALAAGGYELVGNDMPYPLQDVSTILEKFRPQVLVMQDKREWEGLTADKHRDPRLAFTNVESLRDRDNVFRVTVLKDSHQNNPYHRRAADEMGAHAWVCYYHPDIVCKLAPFVRREHVVRTHHSLDRAHLPSGFLSGEQRRQGVLSGAVSRGAYPLRWRLFNERTTLQSVDAIPHPGYHRHGCQTPNYLRLLSRYKVSICTASVYGYLLRKIIESSAVGCIVITDLPADEVVPEIDHNLVRVRPEIATHHVEKLVMKLAKEWDGERQLEISRRAIAYFNLEAVGRRLSDDIEELRLRYNEK